MAFEVVVIGGGPAGVTAALRARELGATVALVERGDMGGTCTNDGCVPTRVLARAARLVRDAEQFADYGLVGRPPRVDFARLLNRTRRVVREVHGKKQLEKQLEAAGASVLERADDARFVDGHTLGDGSRLSGERFVVCAGGHARRIEFPGAEHAITHSDVWTMEGLPSSIAIVGAAATGCQLASVFAARPRCAHSGRAGRGGGPARCCRHGCRHPRGAAGESGARLPDLYDDRRARSQATRPRTEPGARLAALARARPPRRNGVGTQRPGMSVGTLLPPPASQATPHAAGTRFARSRTANP